MGKSKHNTPKPGSNRAKRLAERRAEQEKVAAANVRPFEGLAVECDLVAMREFVPSATAELAVPNGKRPCRLATVLPGAVAALVRDGDDPTGYVALQTQYHSGDPAADLAVAIRWTQTAEPTESLLAANPDADSPTLRAVVDPDAGIDITVHDDFNWWIPAGVTPEPQVAMAVEQANAATIPTARLDLPDEPGAAWWIDAGEKAHIRWVWPANEDDLMQALARVHAAGRLHLGDGSRYAGSFRTHGLLVPVFDLDRDRHPDEWRVPAVEFGKQLQAAIRDAPLTADERRSRDGLRARQVTLR